MPALFFLKWLLVEQFCKFLNLFWLHLCFLLPFLAAVHTGAIVVEWFKPYALCHFRAFQTEVVLLSIAEQWVGENTMSVVFLLPRGAVFLQEGGLSARCVVVAVVVHVNLSPCSCHQHAMVHHHNVMLEGKGSVIFNAACLQLLQPSPCEDIVANDIVAAVVLVKATALGVVDKVVFHNYSRAALVSI